MINLELNKKMNKMDTSNKLSEKDSQAQSNLLNNLGSNGTVLEGSSFNLDDITIPINLNFTQSIENNTSVDIKNTPVVTKANNSQHEKYPDFETK